MPSIVCGCGDVQRCERCTNCDGTGLQGRSTHDFRFLCNSCGGTGWVHGSAADMIVSIRIEMREERVTPPQGLLHGLSQKDGNDDADDDLDRIPAELPTVRA